MPADDNATTAPPDPLANGNGTAAGAALEDGQAPPPDLEDAGTLREQLTELRQGDRQARKRIRDLEAELTTIRASSMTEQERAISEATATARAEADAEWRDRYLTLRIERLAATRLADPSDAVRLLDLADLEHDTGDATINQMLEALVTAKPYLAASSRAPAPPVLDRGPSGAPPPAGESEMNRLIRAKRH